MKSLQFSADSWHYKMIYKYTPARDRDLVDICSYTRYFLFSLLTIGLILAGVTLASFILTQILVGIGFSLWHGMLIFSEVAKVSMGVITVLGGAIGIVAFMAWVGDKHREYKEAHRGEPDGFVKEAYKSWKEKYCARVEIVRPVVEEVEEGPADY